MKSPENYRDTLNGRWNALWKTDPPNYPEYSNSYSFEMHGEFIFEGDQLTIVAYGHANCIFGVEIVFNTSYWNRDDEGIQLHDKSGNPTIRYEIAELSNMITKLFLDDDIFITLTKNEES